MKYFDEKSNLFCSGQNEEGTLQPYDDVYWAGIYERARGGERINVEDLQVPSFIDAALLQKSLLMAYYLFLKNAGGDAEQAIIAELEEELFPVTDEQPEAEE